jgi:hypothetical protein
MNIQVIDTVPGHEHGQKCGETGGTKLANIVMDGTHH